ncbi:hypothetical protein BKM31_52645 [[Actinomadura] parvosata subsp. kistnae]|uniref:Ribbon-helix-helix protein CopG domain-containing protein n=1 Tax=[Actinomadura] parvosata subsp. kistnae TaxID=1909395 RepID=A0A1V0AFK0_9ACTN|nr:hypothetical protein BKM31_52645 [Nonomuraea sp. ATCC 55076]
MRRTTVRIDETLLNEAKAYAAKNGRSLTSVMEDALRQLLNRATEVAERPRVELITSDSKPGFAPMVQQRLDAGETLEHILSDLEDEEWVERARNAAR